MGNGSENHVPLGNKRHILGVEVNVCYNNSKGWVIYRKNGESPVTSETFAGPRELIKDVVVHHNHILPYTFSNLRAYAASSDFVLGGLQRCPLFLLGSVCFTKPDGRPCLPFRGSARQLQNHQIPPPEMQMHFVPELGSLFMPQGAPAWSLSGYSGRDAASATLPMIRATREHYQWSR